MKNKFLIILPFILLFPVLSFAVDSIPRKSTTGRYQLFQGKLPIYADQVFMIDSETGRIWMIAINDMGDNEHLQPVATPIAIAKDTDKVLFQTITPKDQAMNNYLSNIGKR